MIQYDQYLTKNTDCCVLRSVSDKKKYRFFRLNNGMKVFIIQDERKSSNDSQCEEQNIKRIRLDENSKDSSVDGLDKMAAVALTLNAGSFNDPEDLQGLSHFVEHVVFMGNKEYPIANELDNYLSKHGGYTNAHTRTEFIVYEAKVPNSYLDGCLTRFAACFKGTLFRQEHIESEINPVNNEFFDNFSDDDVRFEQFVTCLAKKDHPLSKFSWGNYKSLLENKNPNEVRAKMIDFFNKNYKASRMSLVIQSQESLDLIEELVRKYFEDIPTEVNNDPTPEQIDEEQLIKNLLSITDVFNKKDYPFEKETLNHLYIVDPIEDGHTLRLHYCFPSVANLYKLKPLFTLGSILGYEGKNSLTRFLIKKKLVLELLAGFDETSSFDSSKYHSFFNLVIKLTDEGLEKVDLIIRIINYYIDLMVCEGTAPQKRLFDEEKLINLIDIRFEDEKSPSSNVNDLSKNLFLYPLEYIIIGPKLLHEFNADVVKYCLEFIKTQPKLTVIQSKKLFNESNRPVQADHWSDVQYKIEQLPEKWSEPLIVNEEIISNLQLPAPNEFISKEFELKKQDCFFDQPILIDEDKHYRFYFKNDKIFQKPKACIYLIFQSNYFRQSQQALVSLKFYVKFICLIISEHAYPAELASLNYSINATDNGLELKFVGFNDKLFKLMKLVLDAIIKLEIDLNLFDAVKQEFIRDYYNEIICNDYLVLNLSNRLQNKYHKLITEQREIAKNLNIKTIKEEVLNFFKTSYYQCLIEGNYTKSEAQEIFDYVKSTSLSSKDQVNLEELKKSYTIELPSRNDYCYVKSFNKLDENVLVLNNYQLGKFDKEKIVMLDLLMQEMFEPLFNILRTEQSLAYHLYCTYTKSLDNICSYQIFVKSLAANFTPFYVDQQIEWFIDHFLNENILKMTQDHFKEIVEAKIKIKQVPFLTLKKEANFYWSEILKFSYCFNKLNEEIEILKKLQLDQLVNFSKIVLMKTPERKKLSVCSIGNGKKTEECFTCSDKLNVLNESEDEFNNDKIAYSLIYMKPKQELKDTNCKLIDNVENYVNEVVCFQTEA